jgi:hypothetical protein
LFFFSHFLSYSFSEISRFDPKGGDIVLKADQYVSREENRRLCLEQLHLLLKEGQAKEPSSEYLFSNETPSNFLSESRA